MKKVLFGMSMLLSLGMFCACSSDDDEMGTDSIGDLKTAETENYDPTFQVNYYTEVPGLNVKLGHWSSTEFIELSPQSTPPYNLLVQWNDEQGKKAIDYILEKNSDVMTIDAYNESSNEYRITSNRYFESPYFYVSSYYKSSEYPTTLDIYDVVVLPQIMLKMNEGKSLEVIMKDYADVLTFRENLGFDIYFFDCNLKTSRELLELNAEICQREDVKFSDFNTYGKLFY